MIDLKAPQPTRGASLAILVRDIHTLSEPLFWVSDQIMSVTNEILSNLDRNQIVAGVKRDASHKNSAGIF